MAIRQIMKHPWQDQVLRAKSQPVNKVDDEIRMLLQDMADTMYFLNGVGLSAPQVGLSKRVAVVDIGAGLIKLVNPIIVEATGEQLDLEGCLSIPGMSGVVQRPEKVVVQALNEHGEFVELTGTGLAARAFCHEIDHLDGILFIDKVIPEGKSCMIESGGADDHLWTGTVTKTGAKLGN
ncbi:MAG: def3 [Firmicutes bacterium]|nr:def3 [Bacillota bacterium]